MKPCGKDYGCLTKGTNLNIDEHCNVEFSSIKMAEKCTNPKNIKISCGIMNLIVSKSDKLCLDGCDTNLIKNCNNDFMFNFGDKTNYLLVADSFSVISKKIDKINENNQGLFKEEVKYLIPNNGKFRLPRQLKGTIVEAIVECNQNDKDPCFINSNGDFIVKNPKVSFEQTGSFKFENIRDKPLSINGCVAQKDGELFYVKNNEFLGKCEDPFFGKTNLATNARLELKEEGLKIGNTFLIRNDKITFQQRLALNYESIEKKFRDLRGIVSNILTAFNPLYAKVALAGEKEDEIESYRLENTLDRILKGKSIIPNEVSNILTNTNLRSRSQIQDILINEANKFEERGEYLKAAEMYRVIDDRGISPRDKNQRWNTKIAENLHKLTEELIEEEEYDLAIKSAGNAIVFSRSNSDLLSIANYEHTYARAYEKKALLTGDQKHRRIANGYYRMSYENAIKSGKTVPQEIKRDYLRTNP